MVACSTWRCGARHRFRYKIIGADNFLRLGIFIWIFCTLPAFGQSAPFRINQYIPGGFVIRAQDDFALYGVDFDRGRCAPYKINIDKKTYRTEDARTALSPMVFPIQIAFGQQINVEALIKNEPFESNSPGFEGWIRSNNCKSIVEVIIKTNKGDFKWNP